MNSTAIGVSSIRESVQLQQLNAGNDDMLHGASNTYLTASDKPSQSLCSTEKSGTLQEKKQVHLNQNEEDDDRKENIPNAKSNDTSPKISKNSGQRLKKTHVCPKCSKRFIYKAHFTNHLMTHSGTKQFPCTMCNQTFAFKGILTRHVKIHNVLIKTYNKCNVCKKVFQQDVLSEHLKSHQEQIVKLPRSPQHS